MTGDEEEGLNAFDKFHASGGKRGEHTTREKEYDDLFFKMWCEKVEKKQKELEDFCKEHKIYSYCVPDVLETYEYDNFFNERD